MNRSRLLPKIVGGLIVIAVSFYMTLYLLRTSSVSAGCSVSAETTLACGNFRVTSSPTTTWGFDSSGGGAVLISNNGTADLPTDFSGSIEVIDENANNAGVVMFARGSTVIISDMFGTFSNMFGTANRINFFFNAETRHYRIENKTGTAVQLWIFSRRIRPFS